MNMKTTFINISDKTIAELLKNQDRVCMWVVDRLPPNKEPELNLIVATADKGDRFIEIIAKWLTQLDIKPHREHIKRYKQLSDTIQDVYNKADRLVLVIKDADNLDENKLNVLHTTSESYGCPIILQGDLFHLGERMIQSKDFIQRVYIGVHAQDF